MRKWLQAILILPGLLLPAGCGPVRTPGQAKQPTAVEPSVQAAAPAPGLQTREQSHPATSAASSETTPVVTPTPQNAGTAAETGGHTVARAGSETPIQEIGKTKNAFAGEQEHVDSNTPVPVETSEPDSMESAQPDKAVPPAQSNEPARSAGPNTAPAAFYERYAAILKTYEREDGSVDYATLGRHRIDLKDLLMTLDELDPNAYRGWPREEKLGFWINAYNLKMLEIITRNYPIQSSRWLRLTWPPSDIRHIRGIWTDYKFLVMDEEFTLAAVEQQFFARGFGDPRVYLALAYATRSGPPLRREPYRGTDLDGQLDEQVRRFLSSPQGLQIDRRNMVVRLSAIFKPSWRGKEFVGRCATDKKFKDRDAETRAVLNFLTNYLSREDAYFLEVENYAIEYMNFDWRLNDASSS
jgi:hypothetical protein